MLCIAGYSFLLQTSQVIAQDKRSSSDCLSTKVNYRFSRMIPDSVVEAQVVRTVEEPWGMMHLYFDRKHGYEYYSKIGYKDHYAKMKRNNRLIGSVSLNHDCWQSLADSASLGYHLFARDKYRFLIMDSLETINWTYFDQQKTIIGKRCKLAVGVTVHRDSIVAWFTEDFSSKANLSWFRGLKGLMLEAYDQRMNRHYVVESIICDDRQMDFPAGIPRMTRNEWRVKYRQLFPDN